MNEALTTLMTPGSWKLMLAKGGPMMRRCDVITDDCFAQPRRFLCWSWFRLSDSLAFALTRAERRLLSAWLRREMLAIMARPALSGGADSLRQMLAALAEGRAVWIDGKHQRLHVANGELLSQRVRPLTGLLSEATKINHLPVDFRSWAVDTKKDES